MFDSPARILRCFVLVVVLSVTGCNSPFQVKQVYKPQLVLYGIAFRGDSSLVVRIERDSETSSDDSTNSTRIPGLTGTLINGATGNSITMSPVFVNSLNLLQASINLKQGSQLDVSVEATGYPNCSATLDVLDSGVIYPAYYTLSVLHEPFASQQNPLFTIYPSSHTMAIRLVITLRYQGVDLNGDPVSGEIRVNPSYEQDTTSYFLKINGAITEIDFPLQDYASAFAHATGQLSSGTVTAVISLLQIDATLYDFYSISNGFNDPLTMRTEKPVFTNVTDGLGFFGSASNDSMSVNVYP